MSNLSDQTVELVGAYIEGDLDAATAAAFEAQMAADPALLAEVEAMREMVRQLASLERPVASEQFSNDLAARMRTRAVTARRVSAGLDERWLQLLLLLGGAGLAWLLWNQTGKVVPTEVEQGSGSGSGVEEIVVPALPAGEIELEPPMPSRTSGGAVMPMKALEKRYEVTTDLDAEALLKELHKVVAPRQIVEVAGGYEVTLDAKQSDAERAGCLRLGRIRVETVTLAAGERPPIFLRSRPAARPTSTEQKP